MLLLRNLFMNNFSSTQFFVQGCYPTDNFNNNNPFLPFVSGQGTYPVAEGLEMRLPQFFIENLRSLTAVTQKGKNPISFLPVLGKYDKDELNWKDYYYLIPGSEVTYYLFTDPDTAVKREKLVSVKGGSSKIQTDLGAEAVISLVDGSTGSNYVAINSPFAMTTLQNLFNAFVSKISPYVNTLTCLGTDSGISNLRMVNTTQMHFENVQGHPSMPKNIKYVKRDLPDRFTRVNSGSMGVMASTSLYQHRMLAAWNFYDPPMNQPFELIQNLWIAAEAQLWFNGTPNEIVTLQKEAAKDREENTVTYTAGSDQTSFYNKHLEYALSMLRSRNGEVSMQDKFLTEQENTYGRGGILSSLVGGLVKAVVPGSGKIVDTVAGFIPF